ncbi:MAG: hypothetical protein V8R51_06070 [Clostridia bacterium]
MYKTVSDALDLTDLTQEVIQASNEKFAKYEVKIKEEVLLMLYWKQY